MEREIPIKIIGQKDEKREKINFFKRDLPPLVTFTDDSSDDDENSERSDGFSIEELESALFSDNEEDMPGNISIVEPEFEDYDDIKEDTTGKSYKSSSYNKENEDSSNIKVEKSSKERVISIQLEDGTIINKDKLLTECKTEEKEFEPQIDERVIPIALATGEVMSPLFTTLDELKPPKWSKFHRNGNEKENKIKIITERSPESHVWKGV